jgi:trigger factor
VERRLTVVVPANLIEEAYAKKISQFAKKANIKGFRPGKAPLSYIQQRFGEDARREALSHVIQQSLEEAITEHNLRPINTPKVEPKSIEINQPLEFVASFEILPEIETVQFTMDSIEKLNVEIMQEDIDAVIKQLLKQFTKWKVVERPAQLNDRVVIDYEAMIEGKKATENNVQNFPLELGSKMMLPGFEEGLIGVVAGDERTLNLSFPEDFAAKERAGKPVDFIIQVKQVFEAEVPTLDTGFIQKIGVQSGKEEDLIQQIKQSLEQERNRLVKEKLKEQVFRALLEQNPLEVPKSLIEREAKNIHDEIYPNHKHHEHHQHSEQELAAFDGIAKNRVMLGLLIAAYAKQTNLVVNQNRVMERIQEIASAYEKPQEVVTWLSSSERLGGIEAQVLEDQVMDKLIESVTHIEKIMSYAALKGLTA